MGTGRTTALWPPRNVGDERRVLPRLSAAAPITDHTKSKELITRKLITSHQQVFSENCTQETIGNYVREFKSLFILSRRKKKAIKPHDRLVLVR